MNAPATTATNAERPLNVTETISSHGVASETVVVASAIDRCLTRSGTFVCEASDETQTKLLSLTHNINSPTKTIAAANNEVTQNTQKERTFKRSLSPIYGELMSMAKRKSMQMPNETGVVTSIGPSLISTPRVNNEQSIPSFAVRNTLSNATGLENTMMFMDQSHVMSSTAVQSTRLIDVTVSASSAAPIANDQYSGKNLTKLLYASVGGGKYDNNDTLVGAGAEDAIADEEIVLVETTRTYSGKQCRNQFKVSISSRIMPLKTLHVCRLQCIHSFVY